MCLSLPFTNTVEWEFISQQIKEKFSKQEEDTCYLPAEMKDGVLSSGIMVSEGILVPAPTHTGGNEGTQESENSNKQDGLNKLRESDADVLVIDAEPLVAVEEVGETTEGSADVEGNRKCPLRRLHTIFPEPNWHRPH